MDVIVLMENLVCRVLCRPSIVGRDPGQGDVMKIGMLWRIDTDDFESELDTAKILFDSKYSIQAGGRANAVFVNPDDHPGATKIHGINVFTSPQTPKRHLWIGRKRD